MDSPVDKVNWRSNCSGLPSLERVLQPPLNRRAALIALSLDFFAPLLPLLIFVLLPIVQPGFGLLLKRRIGCGDYFFVPSLPVMITASGEGAKLREKPSATVTIKNGTAFHVTPTNKS